jgi:RNA polymerase sigma-70 factor, ECF subfamily
VELLQQFAQGDLDAFEALFRQHQADVYHWLVCLVRDPATAEDLTLETFWRIHRAHARFDPQRSFGAWARRIAVNLALNHLHRAPREVHLDENVLEAVAAADGASSRERRAAVRSAFAALPLKLRAVATLALIEEKPYAEIAEALGISVEAVKSREFRAVRLLRKSLTQMDVTP